MKKLLLLLTLFLVGCTTEEVTPETPTEPEISFEERVENYIVEEDLTVIEQLSLDEELLLITYDDMVGMISINESFDIIQEVMPIEGKQVELLHIGDDTDTYFGVVVRDEELFSDGDRLVVSLLLSEEPIEFDLDRDYQLIMVQHVQKSLTSCGAELIEVYKGEELLYSESLVPT